MTFFPTLPSVNENFERESIPKPYFYRYISIYLVQHSQLALQIQISMFFFLNLKYVFKFLNHEFSL